MQKSLHKLFHNILANSGSRERALDYLGEILVRNSKRKQMHVNERAMAGVGFMLNFLAVMQVRRKNNSVLESCRYLIKLHLVTTTDSRRMPR